MAMRGVGVGLVWLVAGLVVLGQPRQPMTAQERAERGEAWRREIRKELYVPETLPKLEAKTWSTFSPTAGVLAERVTYQTADGMVVPAIVYRPDPKVVHWQGEVAGRVGGEGGGADTVG